MGSIPIIRRIEQLRGISSAVERLVYTEWVSGSSPLFLNSCVDLCNVGCMTEWSKVPVLKTGLAICPTWVQIPLHPVLNYFVWAFKLSKTGTSCLSTISILGSFGGIGRHDRLKICLLVKSIGSSPITSSRNRKARK